MKTNRFWGQNSIIFKNFQNLAPFRVKHRNISEKVKIWPVFGNISLFPQKVKISPVLGTNPENFQKKSKPAPLRPFFRRTQQNSVFFFCQLGVKKGIASNRISAPLCPFFPTHFATQKTFRPAKRLKCSDFITVRIGVGFRPWSMVLVVCVV